jgi:hypothetical protein
MIHHLQEEGPPGIGNARQEPQNRIVDKLTQFVGGQATVDIGIKDLQKMPEFLALSLFAKLFIPECRLPILLQVIDERD